MKRSADLGFEDQRGPLKLGSQPLKREQIVLSLKGLVTLRGEITPDDLPGFFARAQTLVSGWRLGVIFCDVGGVRDPDASVLDGLARIQLFVRRHGKEMRLRSAGEDLSRLIDFTGFRTCLHTCDEGPVTDR